MSWSSISRTLSYNFLYVKLLQNSLYEQGFEGKIKFLIVSSFDFIYEGF